MFISRHRVEAAFFYDGIFYKILIFLYFYVYRIAFNNLFFTKDSLEVEVKDLALQILHIELKFSKQNCKVFPLNPLI